ncbi:MAG: hypothetical protein ACI9N9_002361, partial [Enterobacterales bacterium]
TEEKRLYVHRIFAKDQTEDFAKMDNRIADFMTLVYEIKQDITE